MTNLCMTNLCMTKPTSYHAIHTQPL